MKHLLIVGFGGFIGAIIRYKLSGFIMHHNQDMKFPLGTFAVNVTGCLVAGILMGISIKHNAFSETHKLLLFTGILGGFTTFSAFGVDTLYLFQRHEIAMALLYVGLTVAVGLIAIYIGTLAVR
ncbi:hypothetical protein BVX97_06550 [bacterium E08(2017)]|nr:hypothetical protein BVX97_06550 [bacterium E08(2017)]